MGEVAVHHVFAYVDPGTGSMLIQVALAAIVAVPVIVRRQIASVWNSVFRRSREKVAPPPEPDDAPN